LNKGFLGITTWDKRLCVLSNIGLLIFTKAEDKNPRLFPTIDAQLYAVSTQVYNKNYTFRMKVLSGEELVMAALSQDDYDSWIRALKKLKEETDRRKKALDKKHEI
jgi:hypothetical protein